MAAGKFNITGENAIEQGATWQRLIKWKDADDDLISNAGYSARMKIKADVSSAELLSLTDAAGITLGGSNGEILITITSTQTAALSAGMYIYDLELESAGGVVTRLLQGRVDVIPEVTR